MLIPYDTDLRVVTSWNGAGTPIVFSSREACERMLSVYDSIRADNSMPWIYERQAVNGDRVLDLLSTGLRPFKVYLSNDLSVISCREMPIHHISLILVVERYDSGAPRILEVWAANKEFAVRHTNNMLNTNDRVKLLHDMNEQWSFDAWVKAQSAPQVPDEVNFYSDEQLAKAASSLEKETGAKPKPSTPVTTVIPGFGAVIDLRTL